MSAHRHADGLRARARLTDEALSHEIDANRRSERWVLLAAAAAALVTVLAVLVVAAVR